MQTLRASKCGLSTAQLPSSILDVIDALTKAGYEAYIVGGGVRDMMLGLNPKDFDAVTNATPSQIKEVFGRRCRIIGRRFELAHVYSGRELIEVATFRAPPKKAVTSAAGMILRDNNWGTIEQDFVRRDFSINAMYYQPRQGVVLDFCNAYDDIKQKRLRLLGDAMLRFEEDPVRMLRTLRFAAKLNFSIDESILDVFTPEAALLLRDVSPHRLYDESQKLFTMGHLNRVMPMLIEFDIWHQLFADIQPEITPFIERAAKNTDQRISIGKTINPAFFYAVLLWKPFLERCEFYAAKGVVAAEARAQAGLDVLKRQATRTVIPRFAETFIREVWEMQTRLLNPKPQQIEALSGHARFRAGFDFLLLREKSGDKGTGGMGVWWESYQTLSADEKERTIADYNRQRAKSRRKGAAQEEIKPLHDVQQSEIEPLVNEPEPRSRRARKMKQQADFKVQAAVGGNAEITADHPILKRKRVKRDLSTVIFGPTQ
ncbi:polynucleotide adenylyltransferase PcnB [Acinetobacter tianfuensis]|uniref:Poly(A) polymerase I n=1 Tax=Acinetobacter tianfuensis TaxID=2419603 RepID=A0A3A8EE86_9GAMM|nr:polynucleotide adenylyltransferase PcnB [Acinetobacter tianfuensis]RKG33262.1 polynucleotide adenylyltransferase PcnB [Acinetobacter tianfuensis]